MGSSRRAVQFRLSPWFLKDPLHVDVFRGQIMKLNNKCPLNTSMANGSFKEPVDTRN